MELNGNELNNMAQRYKEEMMRLYKRSGSSGSQTQQNSSAAVQTRQTMPMSDSSMTMQSSHAAPSPSPRDINGTPIPGTPGASNFNLSNSQSSTVPIPVQCECRFPSAESIIESIAGIPSTPNITPEDNPPAAYPGGSLIQPRTLPDADTSMNMNGGTMSAADKTAYSGARNANSASGNMSASLRGVMINGSPESSTYTLPSMTENEREIIPDFPLPADSEDSVPSTAGLMPSMSWISLTGDNSWGFLQFDVFTAGGAYPVPGAVVIIKKKLPGGIGLARVLFTNRSGKTATIALPAPSELISQDPSSTARPFSEYTVTVRARGYYTISDINLPIFAGVKTVQPIDLIPLPENQPQTPIQPRSGSADNDMMNPRTVG